MANPLRERMRSSPLVRLLINDHIILLLIVLNAAVLFLDEFPDIRERTGGSLWWIDYFCIIYFVMEAALKIYLQSWNGYWANGWNRFDFGVVLASLPALLTPFMDMHGFSVFLVLRIGRMFRFVRVLRFIPRFDSLLSGVGRALRASVGIFLVLLIMNMSFALGATILFGEHSPHHFGDPVSSAYTLFKVFTLEGWYDVPDAVAGESDSGSIGFLVRAYFIMVVLSGGILGISLANAIFVDEMTADNTREVERMVGALHEEMRTFHQRLHADQEAAFSRMEAELQRLRHGSGGGEQGRERPDS